MNDNEKTKEELIKELAELRAKPSEGVAAESDRDEYKAYFDYMGDALIVLDMHRRVLRLNKSAKRMLGYSDEDISGLTFEKLFPEREHKSHYAEMEQAIETRSIRSMDTTLISKRGVEIPVLLSGSVMLDREGEPCGLIGVCRDYTQIKRRYEDELLRSEQRCQLHIERTPLAAIEWNTDFEVVEWNQAAEKVFGYTREEALGRHADFIIHKDARGHVDKVWQDLMEREGGERSTNLNVTKDGRTIFCEWYNTPLVTGGGEVIGAASMAHDVTELKAAQDALRSAHYDLEEKVRERTEELIKTNEALRDRERRLLEAERVSGLGHWEYDLRDGKLYWSDEVYRIFNMDPEEIESSFDAFMERIHPEDREEVARAYRESVENKTVYDIVHRLLMEDGSVKYVNERCKTEYDEDGIPVRSLGTVLDITKLKQAEEALGESEGKYRRLFENMQEGFAYCKMEFDELGKPVDWVYLEVNDYFELLTGLKKEDVVGKRVTQAIPTIKETHPELFDIYGDVALTGRQARFEIYFKPLEIWLSVAAYCPRKGYFIAIFGNITERKGIEEALRDSEERFSKVFYASSDIMAITRVSDGLIVEVNDTMLKLFGYERDELVGDTTTGKNLWGDPSDRDRMVEILKRDGCIKNFATKVCTRSGELRSIIFSADTITLRGETHLITHARDITEKLEAEERLRQSEEKFRGIAERSYDAILMTDAGGHYTYISPGDEKNTGVKAEEGIGKDFRDFLPERSVPLADKAFARVLGGETVEGLELEAVRRDGRPFFIECNITPVYQDNEVSGTQIIYRNITERKRADEVRIKNIELEKVNRLKDEFLANMSHELRTPLNSIIGFSEMLKDDMVGKLTEVQKGQCELIFKSGRHLLDLVNDILDLSKVEAGKMQLELEMSNISELLKTGGLILKETAQKRSIELSLDIADDIGIVYVDPVRFKQVAYNLLSNAVKFTPDGGSVSLSARSIGADPNRMLEVSVTDTGIGIPEKDIERLFTPFEQLENVFTKKYEGTGLGLMLVKRLTELHGGTVEVKSKEGEGSTFTVRIPYRESL